MSTVFGQPSESVAPSTGLAKSDWDHAQRMVRFIESHTTSSALRHILPLGPSATSELVAQHTRFDHGAVLVFPECPEQALTVLAEHGLTAAAPVPSVVVRGRLATRYGLPAEELPVMVTRVQLPRDRTLELFMLSFRTPRVRTVIHNERLHLNETHLAFRVVDPGERSLGRIWNVLAGEAGFATDGGGFNPHHGPSGCTVLYFRGDIPLSLDRWPRRIEIIADGHHPRILRRHIRAREDGCRSGN